MIFFVLVAVLVMASVEAAPAPQPDTFIENVGEAIGSVFDTIGDFFDP